jgi:hypothetical protein
MLDREYAYELFRLYTLNKKDLHPVLRRDLENPEPSVCEPPFDPGVVISDLQFFGQFPVDGDVLAHELKCFAYSGTFAKDGVFKRLQRVAVTMQFPEMRANGKTYEEAIRQCAENHGVSETTVRNILNDPDVFGPRGAAFPPDIRERIAKQVPSPRRKPRTAK